MLSQKGDAPHCCPALEAALDPKLTLHGLLCSTCFSGAVAVVNGRIARAIGMNCGINALGSGTRANATIGRALNLILRNVGGTVPGKIDRAAVGCPGKVSCCFAEDESDEAWEALAARRGMPPGCAAVTLLQGDGVMGFIDQRSRTPEALTRSLAPPLTHSAMRSGSSRPSSIFRIRSRTGRPRHFTGSPTTPSWT